MFINRLLKRQKLKQRLQTNLSNNNKWSSSINCLKDKNWDKNYKLGIIIIINKTYQ